ncbi:MAG: hypothetical protein ACR2F6_03155 [Mycobacteriales bacterium]
MAVQEKPATFDYVRLVEVTPMLAGVTSQDSAWQPHALPSRGGTTTARRSPGPISS